MQKFIICVPVEVAMAARSGVIDCHSLINSNTPEV